MFRLTLELDADRDDDDEGEPDGNTSDPLQLQTATVELLLRRRFVRKRLDTPGSLRIAEREGDDTRHKQRR
jgi:hypothetical protein